MGKSNNNSFAYVALKNGKEFIVKDGVEIGKQYDMVGLPTFSLNPVTHSFTK